MTQIVKTQQIVDAAILSQGSRPQGAGDVIQHTLYDTVKFATTWKQTVEAFAVPQNQTQFSVDKTFGHTNMTEPKKLPAGNRFLVKAIGIQFVQSSGAGANANETPDTTADAAKKLHAWHSLLNYSVLRFKLPTTEFELEVPMSTWLSTLPVVGYDAAAATWTQNIRSGDYLSQKVLKLDNEIPLANIDGSPVQFTVQIMPDTNIAQVVDALDVLSADGDAIRITLLGTMTRTK